MFFKKAGDAPGERQIEAARIVLRAPRPDDWTVWSRLRAESRAYLTPWEPTWPKDELTREAFRRRLRRYADDARDGRGFAFFIFDRRDEKLLGGITMSNIRRGVTQTATIGYWMGEANAGRGLMTEALAALASYSFDELGLHRLEAACLPTNEASKKVLRKVGFHKEGLGRRYLKINGVWRDHVLFAMLADDPRPVGRRSRRVSIEV